MFHRIERVRAPRSRSRIASILTATAIILTSVVANAASDVEGVAPSVRHVTVTVNKSQTVYVKAPIKTATIASTAIADLTPMSDHTLYIQGKQIGTTNISVFDSGMKLVEVIDLDVTVDAGSLQRRIRDVTGGSRIKVSASGGQVILGGIAVDAVEADRAISVAKSMVKGSDIVNAIVVGPSQQVMLKVQFLEASRDGQRELGVNWYGANKAGTRGASSGLGQPNVGTTPVSGVSIIQSAGALASAGTTPFGVVLANLVNNGTKIDVMVSALETKGLVRRLAEPNLVALSGDTARFLAGGEFPVPILAGTGTGATPSIEFKKFGVSLAFTPTVLSRGLINMRIAPEVSELDPAAGVTIQGTTVPGLVTRNAQTTVELRDGQSFAIAGLLQNRNVRTIDQLPWVGTVPVLGSLFRSSAYQNHESDLVIIVTPHLVHPATPADRLATPLDKRLPSNDIDFFVNGQMELPKRYSDYVSSGGDVRGPYGYIIPVEQGATRPVYKGGMQK
jgi:pilus assembly protein CpaC